MTVEQTGVGGGAMAYGVSDEVWREIAVEGERASEGERRALLRVAGVVGLLTVVAAAVALSGIVAPRLSGGDSAGGGGDGRGKPYFVDFTLHNNGITPVHLVGWSSRLPGVEVVRPSATDVRLEPRGAKDVKVTLRTTDCAAAVPAARRALEKSPMSGAGLGVVVDRPWGHVGGTVDPVMAVEDLVLASCGADPGGDGPTG